MLVTWCVLIRGSLAVASLSVIGTLAMTSDVMAQPAPLSAVTDVSAEYSSADDLFQRRILPLATAPQASSCTECHLSGVELKNYIAKDEVTTFASLRAAGLIDVDHPENSKLLHFISRHADKPNELTERVRKSELAAFRDWITKAVRNPALLMASSDVVPPTHLPVEVIRHARKDRVTSEFVDSIWSEMGRCSNCHNPELNRHQIGRHRKEDVDAISWIVPRDPSATLLKLVESGNIDLEDPTNSAVLTKPAALVEHGGGPKFFPGSDTYRKFAAFLTDYAAIRNNQYANPGDLPTPSDEVILLSKQQLRIREVPEWLSGKSVQVDIYGWDDMTSEWSDVRAATAFSRVNAKDHVWQNPIQIVLQRQMIQDDERPDEPLLPPGKFLIRILADLKDEAADDPSFSLTKNHTVAEVRIDGEWPPGYQPPRIINFPLPAK